MNVLGYSDFKKLFQNHALDTPLDDFFVKFSNGALNVKRQDEVKQAKENLLACLVALAVTREVDFGAYHLVYKTIPLDALKVIKPKVEMSKQLYTSFSLVVVDDDLSDIDEFTFEDVKRFHANVENFLQEEEDVSFIDCDVIPSFIVISLFVEGEEISLFFEKTK
ncbi:MAG: hypothetical protein PHE89_07945 [Alphaproteobacteria bacterium]|nr:hypothetical protein [Alphaproteobacteria bacterium]